MIELALDSGIFDYKVYSMFVFQMMVLTALTVPLVDFAYPHSMHREGFTVPKDALVGSDLTLGQKTTPLICVLDFKAINGALFMVKTFQVKSLFYLRLLHLTERIVKSVKQRTHDEQLNNDLASSIFRSVCDVWNVTYSARAEYCQREVYWERIKDHATNINTSTVFLSLWSQKSHFWDYLVKEMNTTDSALNRVVLLSHLETNTQITTIHLLYDGSEDAQFCLDIASQAQQVEILLYALSNVDIPEFPAGKICHDPFDSTLLTDTEAIMCTFNTFSEIGDASVSILICQRATK